MEIVRVVTHSVLLFRHDEIPLQRLGQRSNLTKLASVFEFSQFELAGDDSGNKLISCQSGSFRDGTGEYPIIRLVVEERRILTSMEAETNIVERFFDKVRAFLMTLLDGPTEDQLEPLLISPESELIVHMDFSVDKLLADPFRKSIHSDVLAAANLPIARASIELESIQFQISYVSTDSTIDENGITLSKKVFTIGPRLNVPLSEQKYYSKAPFDTKTHIEILQRLETQITQA